MFIQVLLPFADVRCFIDRETYKLNMPTWPFPREGEFVRYFGNIKERAVLSDYCRARRAIKFRLLGSHRVGSNDYIFCPQCQSRRFYSDGEIASYLSCLFRLIRLQGDKNALDENQLSEIFDSLLSSPTLVKLPISKNDIFPCNLQTSNQYLSRLYLYASTKLIGENQRFIEDWWVTPGEPAIVVEYYSHELKKLPANSHAIWESSGGKIKLSHVWLYSNGRRLSVWLLGYEDEENNTSPFKNTPPHKTEAMQALVFEIALLHSELECLKEVIRLVIKKKLVINIGTEASDAFQAYINNTIRKMSRKKRYGFHNNQILKESLGYGHIINETERSLLLREVSKIRGNILRKIEKFTETSTKGSGSRVVSNSFHGDVNINNLEAHSEGDLFMGDKFDRIRNSTIYNRSLFDNSFNKVRGQWGNEVADALLKVSKEIEKSGNAEAAELFDSFNEELQKAEPKKSRLRSFWNSMILILPDINSLVGIVDKVTKLIS